MPISLPVLDDRNYEQILEEALRRIPVYTPEWTNFQIESDPGVTIVQLFAFLTESLLYRANRVPELNRLKFLQLLNVPLLPASAADGVVSITNERGPVEPLLLEQGVEVAAGNVKFITRDPLNVLPVQVQVYYKRPIPPSDPAYTTYREKYEAVLAARLAEQADAEGLPFPGAEDFEALGIIPSSTSRRCWHRRSAATLCRPSTWKPQSTDLSIWRCWPPQTWRSSEFVKRLLIKYSP